MATPNLRGLRMFDAAARHLNFRAAADELHLTQGAVAQQVRRLEADLGLQLFERHARGLALTDVGRRYHEPIRRALAIIDDATQALCPQSHRVVLSVTPSFASKWLVPRLHEFSAAHPDIEIQTVASEQLADFRTDGVDIAIRQGQPPFGPDLAAKHLAPLSLCAVCGPDMARTMDPIHDLAQFVDKPLVQDSHGLWDRLFEGAGLGAARPVAQFNQTALAMDAAADGRAIALAPRLLVATDLERGRLVELWRDTRVGQGGFYIVHPEGAASSRTRAIVVDWILASAGQSCA